jgi:hypothetical protein
MVSADAPGSTIHIVDQHARLLDAPAGRRGGWIVADVALGSSDSSCIPPS